MDDMMWLIMLHTVSLDENLHIDWSEQKYTHRVGCCQWESFCCCSDALLVVVFRVYWKCARINIRSNERKNDRMAKKRQREKQPEHQDNEKNIASTRCIVLFFSHSIQLARQNSVHPFHCNKIIEWKKNPNHVNTNQRTILLDDL